MRKKWLFTFVLFAVFLAILMSFFVFHTSNEAYTNEAELAQIFPGKRIEISAKMRDRSQLVHVSEHLRQDYSPDKVSGELFRVLADGKKEFIANNVESVKSLDNNSIFYIQDGSLVESSSKRVIARGLRGSFAIDKGGERFVVSKSQELAFGELNLIDKSGRVLGTLMSGSGQHGMPYFSPSGDKIYFVSDKSGLASWYVADSNGQNVRQLTNLNLQSRGDGEMPLGFVPVPATDEGLRFISNDEILYDAGGLEFWRLNFLSGRGQRVVEGR